MQSKPNILLLMGDEHRYSLAGCYGHRVVKTPTLDALAARGAVFDAAYCPSPICAPSRAAMMAGRHVHQLGVWDNAAPFHCDWPTFAHSFTAAGYRTILSGKMHFVGPDQRHGFAERWVQDIYPATFAWTPNSRDGVPYNETRFTDETRVHAQTIDCVSEAGVGRTFDMDYDDEVVFRTCYGLRQLAREPERKPFLLCASLTGPHFPFRAPQAYWDRYRDEEIDLPRLPADLLKRDPEHIRWVRNFGRLDQIVPDDICRKARHAQYARVSMVDDHLAKIMEVMRESGLLENTIVIYTSDHGDMLGDHGLWFKNVAYEASSRVPLIMAGPGINRARVPEVMSLLDLGPTICGLAGIEPVYPVPDGRDLTDLLQSRRPAGPGRAIMENYGEGVWKGWRMLREGKYKLIHVPGVEQILFDLEKDPEEWTNVAADPAYATVLASMTRTILDGWDWAQCDEVRWQSEDRRLAILKAPQTMDDWQTASPPVPHCRARNQGMLRVRAL